MFIRGLIGQLWERIRSMTKARDWPNNAMRNRDEAAHECNEADKELKPLLRNGPVTSSERLSRAGNASRHIQRALRWLENAGAPTLPPED